MENEVIKYLAQYFPINEELKQIIAEYSIFKKFKKNTVLLKAGEISNECFFIIKGCIRSYYLIDGEEKITGFYTEGQSVCPSSYTNRLPSKYYLACVEDTIASVGSPEKEAEAFQKYPQLESMCRILSEKIAAENVEFYDEYLTSNPEERYLNLLKNRPDLLQRVPQYQIASYLGIKPESLSRIRQRIIQNQKDS